MSEANDSRLTWRDWLIFAVIGLWAAFMIASAVLVMDTPEGMAIALAASALTIAFGIIGIWMRSAIGALLGAMFATGAAMIAAGIVVAYSDVVLISTGIVVLVLTGCTTVIVSRLDRTAAARSASEPSSANELQSRLRHIEHLLERMDEHNILSDQAKRIIFRDRELDLLRQTIEDDLGRGDYGAALNLCDAMAEQFGFRQEAEHFRSQVLAARDEHHKAEMNDALNRFEQVLEEHDLQRATQEAARLERLYPASELIQHVRQRLRTAHDEHKRELEDEFLQAAQRDDVEHAMDLLKRLDRYLSPEEAGQLEEVAHGVISKHRENLGVQFKLAVNDHRWAEAARIGETIIEEFPNSKMAGEVRSMIDLLRARASEAAAAQY